MNWLMDYIWGKVRDAHSDFSFSKVFFHKQEVSVNVVSKSGVSEHGAQSEL